MIYFTKYAEEKFDILNKHKVFFTREQIEDAVKIPDKLEKKERYIFVKKEGVGVVYLKEKKTIKIITFYPIKNN